MKISVITQLVDGFGIAGVYLIRLRDVRPKALPCSPGISSGNAAHRFAVTWEKRVLNAGEF